MGNVGPIQYVGCDSTNQAQQGMLKKMMEGQYFPVQLMQARLVSI